MIQVENDGYDIYFFCYHDNSANIYEDLGLIVRRERLSKHLFCINITDVLTNTFL
jgi:hypothetical protein